MNLKTKKALFILRMVLAFTVFMHGVDRLVVGLSETAQHFINLGLPAPTGYLLFVCEIIVGLSLLIGIYPKVNAFVTMIAMIGSIFSQKMGQPYVNGIEIDTMIFAMSLVLYLTHEWKTRRSLY